jgi:RNA polymerase sigma-70 factor (ECF subfamily)
MSGTHSDAMLVHRCLNGDPDAYGELIVRYQKAVYATAYYYVGRFGSAEDVSQDALLAAYKSLPNLKKPERFAPWLKELTCRTASNWLRQHGKTINLETPLPYKRTISIEDARANPEQIFKKRDRIEMIQRAIDTLPERYRLPVILRYLQELSYQEISHFTGETPDEIRGILQRALTQLKTILVDEGDNSQGEQDWHRV